MFKKIKEFFTGTKSDEVQTPAPYKVELAPIPAGTEASVSAPAPVVEVAPVVAETVPAKKAPKAKAPAKPKAEKAPKVAAPKVPAVKKPRAPKAK